MKAWSFFFVQVVHSARLKVEEEGAEISDDISAQCPPGLPEFRAFDASAAAVCGTPAWGNLFVATIGARNLPDADWFAAGTSDPYVRVRLSDDHFREMRGGWTVKEKPVPVTDNMRTQTALNTENPIWNQLFAINMFCPHLPYGPQQSPMGPHPPPIVAFHPANNRLNEGKHGHQFQLEFAVKDDDDWNSDDTLGRAFIPLTELIRRRVNGFQSLQLEYEGRVQGYLDVVTWYCDLGDDACHSQAETEMGRHGLSTDRIQSMTSFDCEMSCSSLLEPGRGRIAMYVEYARQQLNRAIQAHSNHVEASHNEAEARADGRDAAEDAVEAALALDVNETRRLQEEWARSEQLEEMYDEQGEEALANRENAWGQFSVLARQLAGLEGLGAQFCSASPLFNSLLRWAAEPLRNYVNTPRTWRQLSGLYQEHVAQNAQQMLSALDARLRSLMVCMHGRWFQDGQVIINQWETSNECHDHFNMWFDG